MNGLHIPCTPIVVDCWRLRDVPPRSLFFLTHMHADHTSGLNSSWPYPIHCTPTTAKLLVKKFNINPKLVVTLEVGDSRILHVNCPGDPVTISVTVLDANHCPGAAMFFFEGYFGSILYTGDFRLSQEMQTNPLLNGSRAVDILYLDNTYCHPSCQFPTREEAIEGVISLAEDNPELTMFIGLHKLGKEQLLIELARRLGAWIGVTLERFETLKLLEMPDVFKTEIEGCRVQVYPFHIVAKSLLAELRHHDPTVMAVLPSCLFVGHGAPKPPNNPYIKVVPYSDHCSYPELRQFVASVHPRSVRPIVRKFSGDKDISLSRANMSVFEGLLDPSPPHDYDTPAPIQCLLAMKSHETMVRSLPHPPPLKRRSSLGSSGGRPAKSKSKGVHYISPSKAMSACSYTDLGAGFNDRGLERKGAKLKTVLRNSQVGKSSEVQTPRGEIGDAPMQVVAVTESTGNQLQTGDSPLQVMAVTTQSSGGCKVQNRTEHPREVHHITSSEQHMSAESTDSGEDVTDKHHSGRRHTCINTSPGRSLRPASPANIAQLFGTSNRHTKKRTTRKLPSTVLLSSHSAPEVNQPSTSRQAQSLVPGQTSLDRFISGATSDQSGLLNKIQKLDMNSPAVRQVLSSPLEQALRLSTVQPSRLCDEVQASVGDNVVGECDDEVPLPKQPKLQKLEESDGEVTPMALGQHESTGREELHRREEEPVPAHGESTGREELHRREEEPVPAHGESAGHEELHRREEEPVPAHNGGREELHRREEEPVPAHNGGHEELHRREEEPVPAHNGGCEELHRREEEPVPAHNGGHEELHRREEEPVPAHNGESAGREELHRREEEPVPAHNDESAGREELHRREEEPVPAHNDESAGREELHRREEEPVPAHNGGHEELHRREEEPVPAHNGGHEELHRREEEPVPAHNGGREELHRREEEPVPAHNGESAGHEELHRREEEPVPAHDGGREELHRREEEPVPAHNGEDEFVFDWLGPAKTCGSAEEFENWLVEFISRDH